MNSINHIFAIASLALGLAGCATSGNKSAIVTKVPPPPPGVTDLKFGEFFVTPVGPRGLDLTEKLKNLNGQRVRLLGYMVREQHGLPGHFLFTAMPVEIHEHDSIFADDLPPATVQVRVPNTPDKPIPHAPGLMLLTGSLEVGYAVNAAGRSTVVRLNLDPPEEFRRSSRGFGKAQTLSASTARADAR